MQIHELKSASKQKSKKRIGRGGAHGTYSTRGIKGQKSRSGSSVRPGFEGGRTPLQKLLPKKRGVGFKKLSVRPMIITLEQINKIFDNNETVNKQTLLEKKIIKRPSQLFKILSNGEIDHPVVIDKCQLSKQAKEKIEKAGGKVV